MPRPLYAIALAIVLLIGQPSVSIAAEYNVNDACTALGAHHLKNDSNGYYGLICDGSNWVEERLIYLSGGAYGNFAFGPYSIPFTATGGDNSGFGFGAAGNTTTGTRNTAFGAWASSANQLGNDNTAFGTYALIDNTASWNTAMGSNALVNSTSGQGNTAVGQSAMLLNLTGSWNVALGNNALRGNTAEDNVAIGSSALHNKGGGKGNIAVGHQAGDNATSGAFNILIGYDVQKPTASMSRHLNIGDIIFASGLYNTTTHVGIGKNSPVVALDVVGDINYTGVLADVSDIRMKEAIEPIEGALEKTLRLNGISFVMKNDPRKRRELGLSAQDVQEVFPELVIEAGGILAVNYSGMVGPLVEALKEQQRQIDLLKQELEALRQQIDTTDSKASGSSL